MHGLSRRADEPLTTLTAASITDSNCEEQLLGSEHGGEVTAGRFERASGGTLVIDELSDLSAAAQKMLFGVLEAAGSTPDRGHDARQSRVAIVATVSPDYEARIGAGELRRDLVSHLSELTLRVPPLREYAEDVPELLTYYVDKLVDSEGLTFRRFSVAAQNRLRNYPWPDNVRELKNLVRRLLLSGSTTTLRSKKWRQKSAAAPGR